MTRIRNPQNPTLIIKALILPETAGSELELQALKMEDTSRCSEPLTPKPERRHCSYVLEWTSLVFQV